jgi:hypothetical protein
MIYGLEPIVRVLKENIFSSSRAKMLYVANFGIVIVILDFVELAPGLCEHP